MPEASKIGPYIERTDAKLAYAKVHLDELLNYPRKSSGDEYERAHLESFLYHLLGVIDAFYQELNVVYGCGIEESRIRLETIRNYLEKSGLSTREINILNELVSDEGSWLKQAMDYRNQATHRNHIPRVFYRGGERDGQSALQKPGTTEPMDLDYLKAFQVWHEHMRALIHDLRSTLPDSGRPAS